MPLNTSIVFFVLCGVGLLVTAAVLGPLISLFVQARFSNAPVELFDLIGMRLRKVDPKTVVYSLIRSEKAGLGLTAAQLETHYLSGGRVPNVVTAMIEARVSRIPLDWDTVTALDLAGRDVVDIVQAGVKEQWLDCTGATPIRVRSLDGVLLRVEVRIKTRSNAQRVLGGASQQTLIDRVVEAATAETARFDDGRRLADEPGLLNRLLERRALDRGSAFDVLAYDATVWAEA